MDTFLVRTAPKSQLTENEITVVDSDQDPAIEACTSTTVGKKRSRTFEEENREHHEE